MAIQAKSDTLTNRLRLCLWTGLCALCLIPVIGVQVSREVNWTGFDFAVFAAILIVFGLGVEAILRLSRSWTARFAWGTLWMGLVVFGFAHLAVGIIGDGSSPANLLVLSLPAIALAGAAFTRGRSGGMAIVAGLMCAAQLALGAYAASLGSDIWRPTAIFTLVWLTALALFTVAARSPRSAAH
jgi:hypothetical protein